MSQSSRRYRLVHRTEVKFMYGVTSYGTDYTTYRQCKVYWDSDWQEYVCRTYIDGKHYEAADYFDNDKESAISHAEFAVGIE